MFSAQNNARQGWQANDDRIFFAVVSDMIAVDIRVADITATIVS